MNVKGQGLLNGAAWLRMTYGESALAKVLDACSDAVRERRASITAVEWHPVGELVEFATVADRLLGEGDGAVAREMGAAGARANMKSVVMRVVAYVSKPEFLMRRVLGVWRQYNDEGTMDLIVYEPNRMLVELRECEFLHATLVQILTGWATEVARAIGGRPPKVRIVEYVERGGALVKWDITWPTALTRPPSTPDAF